MSSQKEQIAPPEEEERPSDDYLGRDTTLLYENLLAQQAQNNSVTSEKEA